MARSCREGVRVKLDGKCVVVTGAAGGIGRALAARFVREGARAVVASDVQVEQLAETANEIGAVAAPCDVTDVDAVRDLVDTVEVEQGPIDLFCSNAGIAVLGLADAPLDAWRRSIDVNLMAHVYAARELVPRMIERGGGYLLQTASAAGLLTQLGSAPYTATKHAAVAFAEFLAITYGEQGLKVSVLAPQGVRTAMTAGTPGGGVAGVDGMLEPDDVADAVIAGLDAERFLILPHPQVLDYLRRKTDDYDRWLAGMRRLQGRYRGLP
jgi:NAD(P)-dependent dehydrogenase (short-subunit alcohol dehydrogenase family)